MLVNGFLWDIIGKNFYKMHSDLKTEILRKLIHLSSLWLLVVIYYFNESANTIFFVTLIFVLSLEYIRRFNNFLGNFLNRNFGFLLRAHEKSKKIRLTGASYVMLSALCANILFSREIAIISLGVMLIADSFAAIFGKAFGRLKILDKTLVGCVIFFLFSITVIMYFSYFMNDQIIQYSFLKILFVALAATFMELFSNRLKVDDNLSITLVTGIALSII